MSLCTQRSARLWVGLAHAAIAAAGALFSCAAHAVPADADVAAAEPLSFAEFYRRPIGPRGLEPGARLLRLAGARVQLTGYIARREAPSVSTAILAPAPVLLDDEDEGLADDLPAAVAYLHWVDPRLASLAAGCAGAIKVMGVLALGATPEADGRTSFVRLQADAVRCAR